MKHVFAMLALVLLTQPVFASEEHAPKEFITGSGFDLVHVQDILVGTFELMPVWAEKKCGSHIRGIYRQAETTKEFAVEIIETNGVKKITGSFNGKSIAFKKLDRQNQVLFLDVNGKEIFAVSWLLSDD